MGLTAMENMNDTQKTEAGFTLVELMIAIVVALIVTAAVYAAYVVQQRTYKAQEQVAEAQQNIRAALLLMCRDLRMAGYDPTGDANAGITAATQAGIRFTLDDAGAAATDPFTGDSDGDTADANEDIEYALNGTTLGKQTGGAGGFQPIAEDIQALEFRYTLGNGTNTMAPTAAELKEIVSVNISILARSSKVDHNYTNNQVYVSGGGQNWGPYNDNYRRRLLSTTLRLRNMGL
jgi:type IV pilus assembly protein PilW